ncbi:MAG: TIM44-related membrane protein TimA [Brevundimonas sp.]|nr:MAG: TIM44-related membrane protein TimA [Brevundimonas sp.]
MPQEVLIVIFAVIAALVLFQLYRVLGKPVGRQPEEDAQNPAAVGGAPDEGSNQPSPVTLDAASAAAIAGLKARDPGFDPERFLEGARQAHEAIVRAYANGDREALRPLVTDTVMTAFETGIADREARGVSESVEFVHPARADLELATAQQDTAIAKVRFLAELRTRLQTAGGDEQVEERRTAELWTFERKLNSGNPNWSLARTQPAEA